MKRAWQILIVVATAFTGQPRAWACSQVSFPPVAFPEGPGFVAFSGTVAGHIQSAFDVWGVSRPYGLLVKPVAALVAPPGEGAVEVYPLETRPDCHSGTREAKDLREQHPSGSTVTVVGTLVKDGGGLGRAGVTFVVTQADDFGHVALRPESVPETPEGYLDFRLYERQYEDNDFPSYSYEVAWRNAHRAWFEGYEYLRCLRALANASQPVKRALLRNMAFYRRLDRERYRRVVSSSGIPRGMRRSLLREFDGEHSRAR